MAGRLRLFDVTVLARPADFPAVHFTQPPGSILAQQCGHALVAEPASGRERVGQMIFPVIRRLFAERRGDRHLRHDGGAAAPDQAAVRQHDRSSGFRGFEGRVHAGATGTDHEDIGPRYASAP